MTTEFQLRTQEGAEALCWKLLSGAPDFERISDAFEITSHFLEEMGLDPCRVSLALLPGTRGLDGRQLVWRSTEPDQIERLFFPAGFAQTDEHLDSVLLRVMNTCQPLALSQHDVQEIAKYPFLVELFAEGTNDYLAVPLRTRRGHVHVLSVTTKRAGGWPEPPIKALVSIGEVLALIAEAFEVHELFQERELMLRELNHRVKNNLSLAGSLLRIQSREFEDERTALAFEQSAARIESVAMVHAQLYTRERLTDLELGAYAKDLMAGLLATHDTELRVEFDVEVINVNVEHAVPIALIFNELVTNAFKHGVLGGSGEDSPYDMSVTIRLSERGIRMAVANRVGVSSCSVVDAGLDSFGQQMIEAFARRLDTIITAGTVEDGWYRVELDFGIRQLLPGSTQRNSSA